MNLGQLIQSCEFRTGFNDTNFRPQWVDFINDGIETFATKYPWPGLETLIDLVSDGTRYLILPHYVDSLISLLNRSQRQPVDRAGDFDRETPYIHSLRTTGTVVRYDHAGAVPVLRDPTGYMFFQSTSASDVSEAATVTVSGYVSASGASGTGLSRVFKTESIYPAGTTPITLTNQFAQVVSISKVTETYGDFYFHDAGDSSRHIGFIAQYDTESSFKRLLLQYAPSALTTFEARIRHKVPPLRNNEHAPHPSVDHKFVINHACRRYWESQHQFSKAQALKIDGLEILQDAANKSENFDEPFSRIIPDAPAHDPDLRIEWR